MLDTTMGWLCRRKRQSICACFFMCKRPVNQITCRFGMLQKNDGRMYVNTLIMFDGMTV
jgi:hypothetical protein